MQMVLKNRKGIAKFLLVVLMATLSMGLVGCVDSMSDLEKEIEDGTNEAGNMGLRLLGLALKFVAFGMLAIGATLFWQRGKKGEGGGFMAGAIVVFYIALQLSKIK